MSKKKSIRALQGSELPPDGSPISAFSVGCCVQIAPDAPDAPDARAGEATWYMILFRIGKDGPSFCGRMTHPPSSPAWNSRLGDARSILESTPVARSAWPNRARSTDAAGGDGDEHDPLKSDAVPGMESLDLFSALDDEVAQARRPGDSAGSERGPPPDVPVLGSLMTDHLSSAR